MKKSDNLSREVTPEIIQKLVDAIGEKNVSTSEMERILYSHDLAPLPKEAGFAFDNIPDVVVRPVSAEDVAKVVKIAYKTGVAVTPRGASTWGLGGCVPTAGGIVVDFSSAMNKIYEIDEVNMSVKVGAGCTWKKVYDECAKKGLLIGSYPSSFPAATVGGWVSTGGIGPGGYKYGSARDNVLNMEVVLSDGTLISTGYDKIANNMSGYNLNQLFAGAEGTLGLIATVTMRLHPMGVIKPLAYDFDNLRDMGGPINEIVKHPSVKPLHIAWSDHIHFERQRKAGLHAPDVKNLFLVTLQGDAEFIALEEKVIDAIAAKFGGRKVGADIAQHEWDERCYEFRSRKVGTGSIPAEVVVPNKNWAEFVDECYDGFNKMKMDAGGIIGMIADRSTAMFMPYYFMNTEMATGMIGFAYNYNMGVRAAKYGGRSLGLGIFFAANLDEIRDVGSAEFIRDLKAYADPNDIMNPGHLVCGKTRFGITLNEKLMGIASTMLQFAKGLMPADNCFDGGAKRFEFDTIEEHKAETRKIRQ
ncbi:MAG: FAD-binding oxidoreductase [Methanomassiliicoccaceae archaeon]|jgi:glycolate oxidase|nr:FAD-binding oxidoreductase [Methanomassiliicoccaceae archaeon]